MKIEVKKSTAVGLSSILCLSIGLFLVQILFESISQYGLTGFIYLALFVLTLWWTISYTNEAKQQYKIIDETVDEVAAEFRLELSATKFENYKEELRDHLRNNFRDEKITILKIGEKK